MTIGIIFETYLKVICFRNKFEPEDKVARDKSDLSMPSSTVGYLIVIGFHCFWGLLSGGAFREIISRV
jgi:hypothetical protein